VSGGEFLFRDWARVIGKFMSDHTARVLSGGARLGESTSGPSFYLASESASKRELTSVRLTNKENNKNKNNNNKYKTKTKTKIHDHYTQ